MSLQQLVMSALRVYIFVPSLNKNDLNIATRLLIWGYSCSSWTKANLFLNDMKFKINEQQSRRIGLFHLVMGWLLLQLRGDNLAKFLSSKIPNLKLPLRLCILFFSSLMLDDIIMFILMYQTSFRYKLRGKDPNFSECMICLQSSETDIVESFCENNHSFHPFCIEQWYKPFGTFAQCPTCRTLMEMEISTVRHYNWIPIYMEMLIPTFKVHMESFLIMGVIYTIHTKMQNITVK